MKHHFTALLTLGLATGLSYGATLLTEDFSYADGNLVGNGGWTNHSGSESFIQVSSGAATLAHGGGSREDAGVTFASQTSGIITATFDLTIADDAIVGGGDYEYFAHFMAEGAFNFRSRLDAVEPAGGGDFTLGLATSSSTAEVSWGTDLDFGVVYSVALSFDLDSGLSSLSVDGAPAIFSTGVSTGETIDRFALRQSNSSNDESITVDNLVVSHVPEPSVSLLGGLSLLLLLRRKR
jgi:hypothetical protein